MPCFSTQKSQTITFETSILCRNQVYGIFLILIIGLQIMEIYILSHIQPSQETRPCLDAIGSPSTYPCQWVGQSVSEWQFQIWRYIAIKWQNNPKYGNLSRIFHIYLFFLCLPLRSYGHASSNLPFRCFRWMMMFLFFLVNLEAQKRANFISSFGILETSNI